MTQKAIDRLNELTAPFREGKTQPPDGYEVHEHPDHGDPATSIRKATHCGRDIEVHTTYKIYIDGEPIEEHVVALEDGTVHYHGLPNYSFPSAVELARRIVDRSLEPRPEDELNPSDSPEEHKK